MNVNMLLMTDKVCVCLTVTDVAASENSEFLLLSQVCFVMSCFH